MPTLRIEHPVTDYDAWKRAFDRDPVARERAGVRRYRVMRQIDDPNFVLVDLDFDTVEQAAALLGAMRDVWGRVTGSLISDPNARIVEAVESKEY